MLTGAAWSVDIGNALRDEMDGYAGDFPRPAWDMLLALGVPLPVIGTIYLSGDLGRARIVEENGRWRPAGNEEREGVMRLVLAVRETAGRLIDIVALSSSDPDAWSLRSGDGVVLGMDMLDEATADAGPHGKIGLRLFARPLDLLAAGGDGICVLDWGTAALTHLRCLGPDVTLQADNGSAARVLREALAFGRLPGVEAATARRRMAA